MLFAMGMSYKSNQKEFKLKGMGKGEGYLYRFTELDAIEYL